MDKKVKKNIEGSKTKHHLKEKKVFFLAGVEGKRYKAGRGGGVEFPGDWIGGGG